MKKFFVITFCAIVTLCIIWPFSDKIAYHFLSNNSELIPKEAKEKKELLFYKYSSNHTFEDGYRVKLNQSENLDIKQLVAKSFKNSPDILLDYFGVKDLSENEIVQKISNYERINFFKVIEYNENEVLLGEKGDEFFYLSYSVHTINNEKYFEVRSSTNYWYISIIKPFHVYIMMGFLKFLV